MMREFRDSEGRLYKFTINVQTAREVRAVLGVDFFRMPDRRFKALAELYADVDQLVNVMFVLVRDQAKAYGIDDTGEGFGRALGGDALEAASEAFLDALIDFFPNRRHREAMRKVLAKIKVAMDETSTKADEILDQLTTEDLVKALRMSVSAWPGSVASTPGPTPPAT